MKLLKKTISFLDADNHRATITAEITDRNGYPEFSVSGHCLGHGGQCQDQIKPRTHEQQLLMDLWRDYHLTNLNEIPATVSFIPSFSGHVDGIITAIEKEQAEYEAQRAEADATKTADEILLAEMEEYGIDESQLDAVKAYKEAGIADDLKDFEEAYQGQWPNDEEFAQNLAEEIGVIDEKAGWPNNCIDWKKASKQLMMDYTEQDGYYFRNL